MSEQLSRKMECPICKKKAVFVGVHDDEGNYHGLMGCEYENAPWSGLSYALHHEGWGDCPLCTDGAESTMGGMLFDTAEEAITALSPPNEPLTLDELREMGGQPYWHVGLREESPPPHWNILDPFYAKHIEDYRYGENWLAYRRPPEGEVDV